MKVTAHTYGAVSCQVYTIMGTAHRTYHFCFFFKLHLLRKARYSELSATGNACGREEKGHFRSFTCSVCSKGTEVFHVHRSRPHLYTK